MKKISLLCMALLMSLSLCACGNKGTAAETTAAPATTAAPVTEAPATEAPTTAEETTVAEELPSAIEVAIGETISLDFVELTFNEMFIEKDITQSITTGNVTRMFGPEPEDGKKFIALRGTIKNIAKESLPVFDFFLGEFDIDGYKYEISANDCDVFTSNGETETSVDPLTTLDFIMYASIPDELADNHTAISYRIGFYDMFDNLELSKYRSFEEDPISFSTYQYSLKLK